VMRGAEEQEVAIRGRRRWVKRYEEVRMEGEQEAKQAAEARAERAEWAKAAEAAKRAAGSQRAEAAKQNGGQQTGANRAGAAERGEETAESAERQQSAERAEEAERGEATERPEAENREATGRQGAAEDERATGAYVVIGGTGGIGKRLVEWLGCEQGRKVIVVSRGRRDAIADSIKEKAKEAGGEIVQQQADVCDKHRMKEIIDTAISRHGSIEAVIHSAGVSGGGVIELQTPERVSATLAAKVDGALSLDAALSDAGDARLILFSSHSSIVGGYGRFDYAAANAFLDAFTSRRNIRRRNSTLCINWDTWREAGMAADAAARFNLAPEQNEEAILSVEGIEAFKRILASRLSHVIVSTRDFNAVREHYNKPLQSGFHEQIRKMTPARKKYTRPQLSKPYNPPQNDIQQTLIEIWQDALGIEPIGVDDNYFELGGDSVVSLQVVSRANLAGIKLTPGQVFRHQTIAELAEVATETSIAETESLLSAGETPLTPAQYWFFEQNLPESDHYNQALMLEIPETADIASLKKVASKIIERHDAFRLRFNYSDGQLYQLCDDEEEAEVVKVHDLSNLPEEKIQAHLEEAATQLHRSLNLKEGPLMRFGVFNLGPSRGARLLITVHHLAIDAVSWRILLEDLQAGYEQAARGQAIKLQAKTSSFSQWADRLSQYAQSEEVKQEASYWLSEKRVAAQPIPVDFLEGSNLESSAEMISLTLSTEETRELIMEMPRAANMQVNEMLLVALAKSFRQWTGQPCLLVDIEGHGREELFEDVDLSRTVGWFTTFCPALLDLSGTRDLREELLQIKQQVRSIPQKGIGFGLLKHICDDNSIREQMGSLPRAEVSFLYLGQLDRVLPDSSPFKPAREASGAARSLRGARPYLLEVSSSVLDGKLTVAITYSKSLHAHSTIESLLTGLLDALRALIQYCKLPRDVDYIPADFPLAGLTQNELERLIAGISESEEE
jgi:non-ribosomal peptide synthase protein (TIGR01720 family)